MSEESAFPVLDHSGHGWLELRDSGMALRDYFAAAALQTMRLDSWSDNPLYWEGVAMSAYVCADAMMIARKAK